MQKTRRKSVKFSPVGEMSSTYVVGRICGRGKLFAWSGREL